MLLLKWWWLVLTALATIFVGGMAAQSVYSGRVGEPQPGPPSSSSLPYWRTAGVSASSPTGATPSRNIGVGLSSSSGADFSLDPYATIPVPWYGATSPEHDAPSFTSVEIGDVSGDGRNDVVTIGYGVSSESIAELLVYLQKADGTLANAVRYPVDYDGYAFTALADFNEDGVQDVVVAGMKNFTLFTSDGNAGLEVSNQPIFDPVELGAQTPAMPMDVNRDGHMDLVFFLSRTHAGSSGFPTEETHSRLVIHFGDGLGGFAGRSSFKTFGVSQYDVEIARSVATGDLNQDGTIDLAIRVEQFDYWAQRWKALIRVYLTEESGLVHGYDVDPVMETGHTYSSLYYIAIGDFNQDGRNDLAGSPFRTDSRLWVLHQSASQRFDQPPLVLGSQPSGRALEVSDLDGTRSDDLLVAHDGQNRVTYHLQSSAQLGEPTTRAYSGGGASIGQTSLAVGDITGDGCADAVVTMRYSGLQLLRGTNCSFRAPPLVVCRTAAPMESTTEVTQVQALGSIGGSASSPVPDADGLVVARLQDGQWVP